MLAREQGPIHTSDLVEKFLTHLKARNVRPKTLLWYQDLRRFARSCPELPLAPEPIEAFLAELETSDETKYAYWRRIKALYRFAEKRLGMFDERHGDIPNPVNQVLPPERLEKIPPTLEEGELRALVAAATSRRDREMVLLAIDNGMRAGEIASLRLGQIRGSSIRIRSKKREKDIPISDDRRRALLRLVEARDGHGDYVFLSTKGDGKPLTANGVYQVFKRLMKKAGIDGPKMGSHRVRHAVGRGMLMQGADLVTVQYTLGHRNIASTRRYTNLTPPDVKKKHAQFTLSKVVESPLQGAFFEDEMVEAAEDFLKTRRQR